MRVAIVAHALRAGGGVPVGVNIAGGLPRVRPDWEFLCVVPDMPEYLAATGQPHVHTLPFRQTSRATRLLFEQMALPRAIRRFAPDIIFSLGNATVPVHARLHAMLLQDAHFVYPASHYGPLSPADRLQLAVNRLRLRRSLRYARLVFLQTTCMKARFLEAWNFAGSVAVLPNFLDSRPHATPHSTPPQGLPLRVLVLSRYYPHKNLELIANTFRQFRHELHDIEIRLTISANQHPGARRLLQAISADHLERQIVNTGPIPITDLALACQDADVMLLPSLLESFSGTYLEAMQTGIPIVTSNLDFAHEVCGNAALYFDPTSMMDLAQALIRLRDDAQLRHDLVTAGFGRLTSLQVDWKSALEQAATALEDAFGRI
ncbi:MAG: glycosyltransferase [Gammaproteobacteria bacterium]|nr:MAG: glycosyltransferase [Gammaproteobacteria bacterium]